MKNKKILIGVSGGIAVYKTCILVNNLLKSGADVKVIMTEAATKFVSPLTFQALTNHAVYIDMFKIVNKEEVEHISLAKWADVLVISPATANTIAKIALGIADNLLTTVTMALPKNTKVVFVPAMNSSMWENPITQKNVSILEKIGDKYIFVSPREGILACRDKGRGKIAKEESIIEVIKKIVN